MLWYSQGQIITLEVEDFDMEPGKDYVLIRDGEEPTDRELAILTGKSSNCPHGLSHQSANF
jgi:hypothetical protein